MININSKRVAVVGLGRFGGGTGVTRWLCSQGAKVTVIDSAAPQDLENSIREISDLDVDLKLATNAPENIDGFDVVVVSPAVPQESEILTYARKKQIPVTSEINLFFERCKAPIIGITGSVGKSTTTAMTGEILSRKFTTHVGGNIGKSLLNDLDNISGDHIVVLELSSFQLESLGCLKKSPHIALVTNLQPNHLDRHKTIENYADAKKNILRYQNENDILILNRQDPQVALWAKESKARIEYFDCSGKPFELNVAGKHNQLNAQASWTIARQLGISREDAQGALKSFRALPHRLQTVCVRGGVTYVNDSKCTTPAGAIVAIEAFDKRKVIIIAGGYDKGSDFTELGTAIAQRAKALIAIGKTKQKIIDATQKFAGGDMPEILAFDDFSRAVKAACRLAKPSDTVLLSPACASYDMFTNYEHRGEMFSRLVCE